MVQSVYQDIYTTGHRCSKTLGGGMGEDAGGIIGHGQRTVRGPQHRWEWPDQKNPETNFYKI